MGTEADVVGTVKRLLFTGIPFLAFELGVLTFALTSFAIGWTDGWRPWREGEHLEARIAERGSTDDTDQYYTVLVGGQSFEVLDSVLDRAVESRLAVITDDSDHPHWVRSRSSVLGSVVAYGIAGPAGCMVLALVGALVMRRSRPPQLRPDPGERPDVALHRVRRSPSRTPIDITRIVVVASVRTAGSTVLGFLAGFIVTVVLMVALALLLDSAIAIE